MDARISYIDANPDILDILQNVKFAIEGVGKVAEAVLGTATRVDGFACTPTSPASMTVNVGAGQIYQQAQLVAAPISSLVTDSHTVMKQGLLRDALALTLVAPTTPGFAQNVLIQVQYADDDTSATQVFNYYNANNPDVPLTGPSGNNQPQTLLRKGVAQITTKYGAAATAGSQVTPNPDAGWAPLYVVTLSYGQTAITAGNIALAAGAPFIGTKLSDIPDFIRAGNVPRIVTSTTFYVRPDGSDANDGSANDAGHAFLTIDAAITATRKIATTGTPFVIQLGGYAGSPVVFAAPAPVSRPGALFQIIGDPANQDRYVIAGAGSSNTPPLTAFGCQLTLSGLTCRNTGAVAGTVGASENGKISVDHITFTATSPGNFFHINAFSGGVVSIGAGCIVASSMAGWLFSNGFVVISPVVLTFTGNPAWSSAGVQAQLGGRIALVGAPTISGAATGNRFYVDTNGVIQTNGSGANFFPGSASPSAPYPTGGQYV